MVTRIQKWKVAGSKKRFIGKPTGQIQERVQAAGPERFGIVSVDCAKRRSKWMLCNFYGKVIVEPTTVENTDPKKEHSWIIGNRSTKWRTTSLRFHGVRSNRGGTCTLPFTLAESPIIEGVLKSRFRTKPLFQN